MSAHYSKFLLNTYSATPYFRANMPENYPLSRVLQKSRAFRRLPPNLKELSALSKEWAHRYYSQDDVNAVAKWYDEDGNELDPDDGHRLTDEEINAQWIDDPAMDKLKVKDVPIPTGGFADPNTWEPPPEAKEPTDEGITEEQLLKDIKSHGREYVAKYYDVLAGTGSDAALARTITEKRGGRTT